MKPFECSKSYTSGSETFSQIEFREPGFADYRQLGAPVDVQRGIVIRDREVIFAYVDRLATKPSHGALQVLNLGDTMALEEHVIAFFIEARKSRASLMSSFSGSDGAPNTSIA
ncbi:hypothetical protein ABLE91_16845 [Aquabacter sp. CN5-332]|uniref:hypothetical protein n=1 Tax=Aquabacter sp. CN5-332 TaxID=3156608 RepID=UPI0032B464DA